jgi:hypothetical protein
VVLSIDNDIKKIQKIAGKLTSRGYVFGKEIDELLSKLEGKIQMPFKCSYCGIQLKEEDINSHKCKGKRYVVRLDKMIRIKDRPRIFKFYNIRFFNKDYWFESKEYALNFIKIIRDKKSIQEAIKECGSELILNRFPKFKTKNNEVIENDDNNGNRSIK